MKKIKNLAIVILVSLLVLPFTVKADPVIGTAASTQTVTLHLNQKLDLTKYFDNWQDAIEGQAIPGCVTINEGILTATCATEFNLKETTATSEKELVVKVTPTVIGTALWSQTVTIKVNEKLDLTKYFDNWQNAIEGQAIPSYVTINNGILSSTMATELTLKETTDTSEKELIIKVVATSIGTAASTQTVTINVNEKLDLTKYFDDWQQAVSSLYHDDSITIKNGIFSSTMATEVKLKEITETTEKELIIKVIPTSIGTAISSQTVTIKVDEKLDLTKYLDDWQQAVNSLYHDDSIKIENGIFYSTKPTMVKLKSQVGNSEKELIIIVKKDNDNVIDNTNLANKIDDNNVKWSSSDESIAKVDNNGNVQFIKNGIVSINAKGDNKEYKKVLYSYDNEVKSQDNKVTILYDNGVFDSGILIDYKKVEDENIIKKYNKKINNASKMTILDINLLNKDNVKIQPNGEIIIKLNIPEGYDINKLVVYRSEDNGDLTKLNIYYDNDYVYIKTTHFSDYIITEEKDTNPKTGSYIPTFIIVLGLMLSMGIVFYTKKNNKLTRL